MTHALKPLQMATTALCEAEIVSVSFVYPIICSLVTKHLVVHGQDLPAVKKFKHIVRNDLVSHFSCNSQAIVDRALLLSSALDPCHYPLGFLSPRQRLGVYEVLRKKYEELKEDSETN